MHKFPESFFFAVVKEGVSCDLPRLSWMTHCADVCDAQIGPLLATGGMGASLLRPAYDPATMPAQPPSSSRHPLSSTSSLPVPSTPPPPPPERDVPPHLTEADSPAPQPAPAPADDAMMDSLNASMAKASLAFVPRAVSLAGRRKASGVAMPVDG